MKRRESSPEVMLAIVFLVLIFVVMLFVVPYIFVIGMSWVFNYSIEYSWKEIVGFWSLVFVIKFILNIDTWLKEEK